MFKNGRRRCGPMAPSYLRLQMGHLSRLFPSDEAKSVGSAIKLHHSRLSALPSSRDSAKSAQSISEAVHHPSFTASHISLIVSPTNPTLISPTMSDQSGPSHLQELFEAAFREYESQTGNSLANHPLAQTLQNCDSVESITAILSEQTGAFSEIREKDKILKPVKNVLSVLLKLSSASDLGLVRPHAPIAFQSP
jgi:hypothetical protein